jgi:hypothetical protein
MVTCQVRRREGGEDDEEEEWRRSVEHKRRVRNKG